MHDAVVLAECIVKHCGGGASLANDEEGEAALERALAAYEEDMFVRGWDLIRRSTENGVRLLTDNATALFLAFVNGAGQQK